MRPAFRRLIPLAFLLPVAAWADGWTQLKPGMTRQETTAVLGGALITSAGRGFEVSIYDERAELVYLEGRLVSWTAPVSSPAAPPPPNTWQFEQRPIARPAAAGSQSRRAPAPARGTILPAYRL